MNQAALFCDGTESYVIPPEPEMNSKVTIRFRTAKNDRVKVFLLSKGEGQEIEDSQEMEKEWGDHMEEYYSKLKKAWNETKERILTYGGKPAYTPFCRLTNGKTRKNTQNKTEKS